MSRTSLKNLDDWITDPVQLLRLDALVVLTQRVSFIKSIMNLKSADSVVAAAIERSCQRRGLQCKFPRGKPASILNFKELSVERRYACSVMLKALYNNDDAGLEALDDGTLVGSELLDRMIFVFNRFIHQARIAPADAPLSFEHFAFLRSQYSLAELEFIGCDDCGSEYISGRHLQGVRCPICAAHRHAIRSKNQEPLIQQSTRRLA
jgi:hypothetical protein